MRTNILLLIGILAFTFSCSTKKEDPFLPEPDNLVNFSDLREGQQTTYIRYTTKCDSLEDLFQYTGDTLILEVVSRNDSLFFKETVTVYSPLYLNGQFTEPVEYPVTLLEDKIYIPERFSSALFFFYENDYIYLKPQHDVDLVQEGCRLMQEGQPFIGNDIGALTSFEIGNIKVNDKTSISCEPLEDLDAYLIYDNEHLEVSHVIILEGFLGSVEERVLGWKMLHN